MDTIITNARVVNEGRIVEADVRIRGQRIEKIGSQLSATADRIIDANGKYLIPGMIDDQVHFREPGLTHKGDLATESAAAVAGGTTSFLEQPNTVPNTVTQEALAEKYAMAAGRSHANYGFMMGVTNDNLDEVLKTDGRNVPGLKIFLGSSTGNMLVDNQKVLEQIFGSTPLLIAVHCEDEATIRHNLEHYKRLYGDAIPPECHPEIRSAEACYLSSSRAVELAKKTGARLHVFHLSTAREMELFRSDIPLEQKKITAEVCIHHLWFSSADYAAKGNFIKWNPAVKSASDREALWKAVLDDTIDVIATDHAPHTLEEKSQPYLNAPSGGPLVQHALTALFQASLDGKISVEKIVEKTSHNPAKLFKIENRGFIREGYFADIALIDPHAPWTVSKENILYKCGWSPFEGTTFNPRVTHTFVNGHLAFADGKVNPAQGQRLTFAV